MTVKTFNGGTSLTTNSYAFDDAGRLDTASLPGYSASYNYVANSPLISQITFKQNTTTRMTTSRQYDLLNRLTSIGSTANGASPVVSGFAYAYNDANQRVQTRLEDGSYWRYRYDRLGQVTSGKRYWSDGTPVAGQQFEYGFDDIGNRTSTKAGGDQGGSGLRSASYSVNRLNEYGSRDVPGAVDVLGAATSVAPVWVNSSTNGVYRRGEYFRKQVDVSNSGNPVWQGVSAYAWDGTNYSGTESGSVFVAQTAEVFTHDADGNLLTDGRWTYTWDAENRLVQMVARTAVGPQQCIRFEYDWQGRRIRKQVWNNTAGTGTPALDQKFLYDGWNLLAELNATNNAPVRSYLWGTDLSGTMQGAGGVGGLLAVFQHEGANAGAHFCAFDGNGNIAAFVKATDGTISARYEYGPFGELIRTTGVLGKANPFRFSTKYQDEESDLLYYGFRYYSPSTGRWISRDPLGESGGLNRFSFVANAPIRWVDGQGLEIFGFSSTNCTPWVKTSLIGIIVSAGPWRTVREDTRWTHLASFNLSLPIHGAAGYRYQLETDTYYKTRTQERTVFVENNYARLCWTTYCMIQTDPLSFRIEKKKQIDEETRRRGQKQYRTVRTTEVSRYDPATDTWSEWARIGIPDEWISGWFSDL